jgi:AbrB family looped-hinge helix DNA binding protein
MAAVPQYYHQNIWHYRSRYDDHDEQGQVTIPKQVREQLGLKPGCQIEFEAIAGGQIIMKPAIKSRRKSVFARLAQASVFHR